MISLQRVLFPAGAGTVPSGNRQLGDWQLKKTKYYLIEVSVNYRKKNGDDVTPNKMNYSFGIQRFFHTVWGVHLKLTPRKVFAAPKEGLFKVWERRFLYQQAWGMRIKSDSALSHDDIYNFHHSKYLSKETPSAYQRRMIFSLALLNAMRPRKLYILNISRF